MKKIWLCVLLTASTLCVPCHAMPEIGALQSGSAALYAANGQMLYEYHAKEERQPASVTKIMTLLLAMEALERGEVTPETKITGSEHACSMGGTQIWLEPGEQLPLNEMLKAIAVGSANDCAVAVAEHLAGTEAAFVQKMNERAKELGCENTIFINANGLDGIGQKTMTSAHDLALISVELLRHPKILEYTGIWMDSIRDGKFALANTNKMLKSYPGMTGLKTGYLAEAGFCISASAERDGLSLVAVVMAAPSKDARTADVATLLGYGFANYQSYTPDLAGVSAVPVRCGTTDTVPVRVNAKTLVLPKEQAMQLHTETKLPQEVSAPVKCGQALGTVCIRSGETELMRLTVEAACDVPRRTVPEQFLKSLAALFSISAKK